MERAYWRGGSFHQSTQTPATGCAYSKESRRRQGGACGARSCVPDRRRCQGGAYRCPQAHQSGDHDRCLRSNRAPPKCPAGTRSRPQPRHMKPNSSSRSRPPTAPGIERLSQAISAAVICTGNPLSASSALRARATRGARLKSEHADGCADAGKARPALRAVSRANIQQDAMAPHHYKDDIELIDAVNRIAARPQDRYPAAQNANAARRQRGVRRASAK